MAIHNEIGVISESIGVHYLEKKNFSVLETNYRKKFGELDIVAQKGNRVYFIEVKSVSYETPERASQAVSYGTFKPEDHFTPQKLKKLQNTIQAWISEHSYRGDFQLDLLTVRVVPHETFALIERFENVHFE